MRADDFFVLGETAERYELVNGVVVASPSVRPRHWKVVHEVLKQLDLFNGGATRLEIFSEIDIHVDDVTVFRPDLCVYVREAGSGSEGRIPERLTTPPDLILEVLSPGSKPLDLVTKRDAYERFGVREYWVIDPDDGRVRAWSKRGVKPASGAAPTSTGVPYVESTVEGDRLPSIAIAGFLLDLRPIHAIGKA